MEIKTITQTILEASAGHILTNGEAYGYTVSLGKGDSPGRWHEITQEEYDAIMEKQAKEDVSDEDIH